MGTPLTRPLCNILSLTNAKKEFTHKYGLDSALMTPMTWMFIATHEKLRKHLINAGSISSLVQLEYSAFEDATVPLCTFVLQNQTLNKTGVYLRLTDFVGGMAIQDIKTKNAVKLQNCDYRYEISSNVFEKIPSSPFAYWASANTYDLFKMPKIEEHMETKSGIMAGDQRFIQFWYEPYYRDIKFGSKSHKDMSYYTWFPLNSGGGFRKYYGNNESVIKLRNMGEDIKKNVKNYRLRDKKYYFKKGITWGRITSSAISFREVEIGTLFGDAGPIGFIEDDDKRFYLLGLLNSKVVPYILSLINPTLNFQVRDIDSIPVIIGKQDSVISLTKDSITTSKEDWNSFETSWQFASHPFIKYMEQTKYIESVFEKWSSITTQRIEQVKMNERKLNSIFIDMYDLQEELTPEVEDKDVTIRKADLERDVKSFLSYLVGLIFGRYSLDEPGLIFAGGEFDRSRYQKYQPDTDNIIPLTHENYFNDDIVTRITELVELVYGEETLEENLHFIAEALGMKGSESSRDTIRRYFMKDFFKDHKRIYQNRPIYWQLTSGKQEAFKGIFYLHRYDETTLARVRTEYVLPLTNTLTELSNQMQAIIDGSASNRDVANARKALEKYQKQLQELRDYDLILKNLADQHIALDLDDGVKVNYEKFQNIPVKNARTGKAAKMNLLEKL